MLRDATCILCHCLEILRKIPKSGAPDSLWVGLTKKIRLGPGKPLRVIHPAHPDPGKSPPGLGGGFEMFEIYKDGMSANYTPSMGTFAATR